MKTAKIIIVAFFAITLGFNSYSQKDDHAKMVSTKSETLKVSGNCDLCKARIEKAAKLEGVSNAEWDAKSNSLAVTFDPARTNMDQISKKIAAVGHDNSKLKANDKAYNALPGCCKYVRMK